MEFRRSLFDPSRDGIADPATRTVTATRGGRPYVYNDPIILAVNAALAINRPLLVSGEPGSGKSSLARSVAGVLGWRYYQMVVTSRTAARDLLWGFDALRRLADAQAGVRPLPERALYVEPRALWWAFDPADAALRGRTTGETPPARRAEDPGEGPVDSGAVVLLDEIDKADPDVPNDLLEPLDDRGFEVEETGHRVARRRDVLVILTTNGERELPPAFLRRCVGLALEAPTRDWLVQVARQRFGRVDPFFAEVADQLMAMRKQARRPGLREPSTAEFLDAIEACNQLGIRVESEAWSLAAQALLLKRPTPPKSEAT